MDINQEVSPEFYFYLADGRVVKSLRELAEILDMVDSWIFDHHVNAEKNDFSNWIKDVYGNENLAKAIRGMDRKKMTRAIRIHLERERRKTEKQEDFSDKMKRIKFPKKKSNILNLLKNS
ncbi:MAG: hypothetical protein WC548_03655 [Candidatus Pacearchaeota archaeon]